jgi:hypothetical protein
MGLKTGKLRRWAGIASEAATDSISQFLVAPFMRPR